MDLPELDITEPAAVDSVLGLFRPDAVVNCAAYTDVDAGESEREKAWALNADAPRRLAEWLQREGGRLIHLSTDYVFDGCRAADRPYRESDPPAPRCFYGKSKLAGEVAVREAAEDVVIVRTAWLYSVRGRNFPKTILRRCVQYPHQPLRVVNDQRGSPTWTYRLARQIEGLLDHGQGLYHATSEGDCTWFDLARTFLGMLKMPCPVLPCTTKEYPTTARRPANSVLENRRLKAEGLNAMKPWQEDLADFVHGYRERLLREARRQLHD
jgi:dTDP-4-dehydrorhamnose reductase